MKETKKLLKDMLERISPIESFSVSSFETFLEDEKTQDAIIVQPYRFR